MLDTIFDEYYPKHRNTVVRDGDDAYVMAGRTPISEANDVLHLQIPVIESHTLGGFITNRLRCIPKAGQEREYMEHRFVVLEADIRCINKVKIERC